LTSLVPISTMGRIIAMVLATMLYGTIDNTIAFSTNHIHAHSRRWRTTRVAVSSSSSKLQGAALVGSKAKLKLDVGREEGTWMPQNWASSGARLLVNVDVEFTNTPVDPQLHDDFIGPADSSCVLKVINGPSLFVGAKGTEEVVFKSGGWCVQRPPLSDPGAEALLRCWVECESGAQRRDASISTAQRINFSTGAWTDPRAMKKIETELAEVEAEMKRVADAEAGNFASKGDNKFYWLFWSVDFDFIQQALKDPAGAAKHFAARVGW